MNFCATPEAQELITRFVGTAPVPAARAAAPERAGVLGRRGLENPDHGGLRARLRFADYMEQQFTKDGHELKTGA